MTSPDIARSSTPRSQLERMAWPRLSPELMELLRGAGSVRDFDAGEVLFEVGQESYDLLLLESGSVQIVDRAGDQVVVTIEAPHFVGELGMLMGQGTFLAGVAAEPSRIVTVPQNKVRDLVSTVPEMSDILVTAFAARRRLLIEWGEGGLTIVGRESDAGCLRLREFASRNRIPHRFVDRADEAALATFAAAFGDLPSDGTAVITGRSDLLVDPTPSKVAQALGLELTVSKDELFDLVLPRTGTVGFARSRTRLFAELLFAGLLFAGQQAVPSSTGDPELAVRRRQKAPSSNRFCMRPKRTCERFLIHSKYDTVTPPAFIGNWTFDRLLWQADVSL